AQVGLNWAATTGAVSYNVYRAATSGGTYTMISTAGAVTGGCCADTTSRGIAPYSCRVSGVNTQGQEGPLSSFVSAAPLAARLRFDFSDGGATTTDSISGVSLNIVNSNGVSADYHGAMGSGVAGV